MFKYGCALSRCHNRIDMVCAEHAAACQSTLNSDLASKLDDTFRWCGIVAYTKCCCESVCTGTYADNPDWKRRSQGIHYAQLALDGELYSRSVGHVRFHYFDWNYLRDNWVVELGIIKTWCNVVGVEIASVDFPEDENAPIRVSFRDFLPLE